MAITHTLNATVSVVATLSGTLNDVSTLTGETSTIAKSFPFAQGTGAYGVEVVFAGTGDFTGGSATVVALDQGDNPVGELCYLRKLKGLCVVASADNPTAIYLSLPESRALAYGPISQTGDALKLNPGDVFCVMSPGENGWQVDEGAGSFEVTAPDTMAPVSFQYIAWGESISAK